MKNLYILCAFLVAASYGCGEITEPKLSPAEQDAGGGNALPDPVITTVSPDRGSPEGGTTLTITGSDFIEGTTVVIGSRVAEETTVVSPTELSVTTPAASVLDEALDILVFNANGATVLSDAFTFNLHPTLASVSPAIIDLAGGTEITILGSGFELNNSNVEIRVAGEPATNLVVVDDNTITASAPGAAIGTLGQVAEVVVGTDNGSVTLGEGPRYLRPGLLMGNSRDGAKFGIFYLDPPTQTFLQIFESVANVSKLTRDPQGGFIVRFGNQGTAPIGSQAMGHFDLATGALEILGLTRLAGGGTIQFSDLATIDGQVFAASRNSLFGPVNVAAKELTNLANVGSSRANCVAPGPVAGTATVINRFSQAIKTVTLADGTVTDTVIPSGDILGGDVFCHGADVLNGTLFAIMLDRSTNETDLVSIDVGTGVVTKVMDIPVRASGLSAMPPF